MCVCGERHKVQLRQQVDNWCRRDSIKDGYGRTDTRLDPAQTWKKHNSTRALIKSWVMVLGRIFFRKKHDKARHNTTNHVKFSKIKLRCLGMAARMQWDDLDPVLKLSVRPDHAQCKVAWCGSDPSGPELLVQSKTRSDPAHNHLYIRS